MLINTKEINSKMVRLIAVQHSTHACAFHSDMLIFFNNSISFIKIQQLSVIVYTNKCWHN